MLGIAVVPAALTGAASSQEPEPPVPSVLVAATADHAELIKTIPIAGSPGGEPRVVMSMGPGQLPDLQEGDRLHATAEVQITADCTFHRPRCTSSPYRYSPVIEGKLVLADGAQVTGGPNAVTLSAPDRNVCHNQTNGAVLQDKGRINVVRLRGAAEQQATTLTTHARVHAALPLNLSKQVVYSQKLEGLQDREQLEVEATMITQISYLPYATRVGARLILAKGRQATGQGHQVKEIADFNGEIAENNGFNCTQAESPCLTRKVGVLKMRKDASGPLYVNLVAITGPKNRPAGPGDHVKIGKSGGLSVTRFPPALFG